MLGIGDIVMPGLLLCFVLRYDNYKKQANSDTCGTPGPGNISGRMQKVSYFHCTLIGYFVGKEKQLLSVQEWAGYARLQDNMNAFVNGLLGNISCPSPSSIQISLGQPGEKLLTPFFSLQIY